ncbi:hypothetical protein ACFL35_15965 [Candidatus Riflebacteria bacterium]
MFSLELLCIFLLGILINAFFLALHPYLIPVLQNLAYFFKCALRRPSFYLAFLIPFFFSLHEANRIQSGENDRQSTEFVAWTMFFPEKLDAYLHKNYGTPGKFFSYLQLFKAKRYLWAKEKHLTFCNLHKEELLLNSKGNFTLFNDSIKIPLDYQHYMRHHFYPDPVITERDMKIKAKYRPRPEIGGWSNILKQTLLIATSYGLFTFAIFETLIAVLFYVVIYSGKVLGLIPDAVFAEEQRKREEEELLRILQQLQEAEKASEKAEQSDEPANESGEDAKEESSIFEAA